MYRISLPGNRLAVWWNGQPLETSTRPSETLTVVTAPQQEVAEVNLLVMRIDPGAGLQSDRGHGPKVSVVSSTGSEIGAISLNGRWQSRLGDDPSFATLPLPAIYGASPDILFEP